jgi:hypothetical protein
VSIGPVWGRHEGADSAENFHDRVICFEFIGDYSVMLPYEWKRKMPGALHDSMRRDIKENLYFKFYMKKNLSFSRFKDLWRESQFGMIHLVCPQKANQRQYLQILFGVFLGLLNDPALNFRDYKIKKETGKRKLDEIDNRAIANSEGEVEDDDIEDASTISPLVKVYDLGLVQDLSNIGVIYGLYCAYMTQKVSNDSHISIGGGTTGDLSDSDTESGSESGDSMSAVTGTKAKLGLLQPIRISVESWTQLVIATQRLKSTGKIGNQARRMMQRLISANAFQIAAYSGPTSIENCVYAASILASGWGVKDLKTAATSLSTEDTVVYPELEMFDNTDYVERGTATERSTFDDAEDDSLEAEVMEALRQ